MVSVALVIEEVVVVVVEVSVASTLLPGLPVEIPTARVNMKTMTIEIGVIEIAPSSSCNLYRLVVAVSVRLFVVVGREEFPRLLMSIVVVRYDVPFHIPAAAVVVLDDC